MLNDIFYVYTIKNFSEKKSEILDGIASMGIHSTYEDGQRISNTDWYLTNIPKTYLNPIADDIDSVFNGLRKRNLCLSYGIPLSLARVWFQQYEQGDLHDWHIHSCAYASVVFVELPDGAETEFCINGSIVKIPVVEGQILTFPSVFPHRSPINNSGLRKTVLSLNIQVDV